VARDPAGGVGGAKEARGRELKGSRSRAVRSLQNSSRKGRRSESGSRRGATHIVGARCDADGEGWLPQLLVTVKVAGKEKRYGFMESSFYLDRVKRRNPPQK